MSHEDPLEESGESSKPDQLLLQAARAGNAHIVQGLLEAAQQNRITLDINCKGTQKYNCGWTPLHLACYFGQLPVAKLLLEHNASINEVNNEGDTPLHKSSYTGREEIVVLLLAHNASVVIKNALGQTAKQVAKTNDIKNLLQGAEDSDNRKKEEQLFKAVRDGDINTVKALLGEPGGCNINCKDQSGNTPLHCAAYRGRKEIAVTLLQMGIDTGIRNNAGQVAIDLACGPQMKQILAVQPIKQLHRNVTRVEGALLRKTRFLGWKPVWAVLERGVFSFFHSRGDAATGSRRKDYKYLDGAKVMPSERNVAIFTVQFSDSRSQSFSICSVNNQEEDRQKWMSALQEHVNYSTHYIQQATCDSDSDDEIGPKVPLSTMQDALKTAQAHQTLLQSQVESVSQSLSGIINVLLSENSHLSEAINESSKGSNRITGAKKRDQSQLLNLTVQLNGLLEYSTKVAASLAHCMDLFAQQEEVRKLALQQEQERCRVLQDALQALAKEHLSLERSLHGALSSGHRPRSMDDTDCEEFFDASDGGIFLHL